MERYLFTHDGYRCVDVDGTILHQSDKHEELFQFVDKDETPIYDMLREYLAACVDINLFKPHRKKRKEKIYHEMLLLIQELHPFCSGEYLDREIASYFNERLVHSCIQHSIDSNTIEVPEITEQQYSAMFNSLFPDGFGLGGDAEDEHDIQYMSYYVGYRRKLSADEEYNPIDSPFSDLYKAKQSIKDYLYWVLDSQAEPFGDLTLPQRLSLYNEYHHPESFRIAKVNVEYYWGSETGIRFDGSYIGVRHGAPLAAELPDGRCMAEVLYGMASNASYESIDPYAKKLLKKTMAKMKRDPHQNYYCAVYGIEDLFTLLFIECQRMYEAKVSIRRCDRCGHYFIANKRMYKYCERYIDDDSVQTCRDVATKENTKKKLSDDPIYYLYNKAYRTHHARIRAGHITKAEFDAWAAEAKLRMNAVNEEPALMDAYTEWLKI